MLATLVLALLGILLGTFTGLVPGIHVNTVVLVILSFLPKLLEYFTPREIVSIVVAMSITHSFVSYIPSILIGAPEEDSVLSVLPGHRLLMQGRGYEAIWLTVVGGLGSIILSCAFLPVGIIALPELYSFTKRFLPFILIGIIFYMIYIEDTMEKKIFALIITLYSGALGILVLNGKILAPKFSLFPALTGLFGFSTLLMSLKTKSNPPEQIISSPQELYAKGIGIGSVAGLLAGLLPSIGASQSALIVQNILGKKNEKQFLVAQGGVNTSASIYAILALYLINNPRSGASIAVEYILRDFTYTDFLLVISLVMLTTSLAVGITLGLAKISIRYVKKIDYAKLSSTVVIFLTILILGITGVKGLIIAVTATSIGFITPLCGIKRSHCMSVLMVPTILYFLSF
jgi:putative membrane protein